MAPKGSLRRVMTFFRGEYGASETYRVAALDATWRLVGQAPWGIGWGGFATQVDLDRGTGRQYPHNLLAEVTLESGWVCGAATVLILAAALAAAWSRTRLAGGRLAFAGVVFCLINALVSGDVNDNRPLFMFVSSALWLWDAR
jgi:O-antigen ligase